MRVRVTVIMIRNVAVGTDSMTFMKNSALIFVYLLTTFISGCGSQEEKLNNWDSDKANQNNHLVLPGAVTIMDRHDWDDTYKKLGAVAFERANKLAPSAAKNLAAEKTCSDLEYLGLANDASSQELKWFGICTNGMKLQISESELT